jgi:hypothetical protein
MMPKYFIGPMSKNIVDSIIEFCNNTNNTIGLIPSRRQVENTSGYVNNWTTQEFTEYVKSKTDKILLVRDHSGPKQGQIDDDGYESLKEDCKYLDIIHIDPWKKHPAFNLGLEETIRMIEYCYELNPNIQFEVGTEEAIRRFEPYELSDLVHQLKSRLTPEIFNQIKYLVIQSGTSLKGTNQTGNYDSTRLKEMIEICKQNNLISKEHNGDYIPVSIIKEKFDLGLDSINIAPEFGLIETLTYIKEIENNWDFSLIDKFWEICFESKKWEKWVNQDFDPYIQKRDLIKICGHYVLSTPEFLIKIKSQFPNIDQKIKNNIKNKLNELYK